MAYGWLGTYTRIVLEREINQLEIDSVEGSLTYVPKLVIIRPC